MWQKIELNYETYIKDIAGQSHEGRLLEIIVYIRSIYKWKAQKKNIETNLTKSRDIFILKTFTE